MLVSALILALSTADAGCGRLTVVNDPLDGRSLSYHQSFDRHRVTGLTMLHVKGRWVLRLFVAARGISKRRGDKRQRARFVVGQDVVELSSAGRARPLVGVRPKTGIYTQWRLDFEISEARLAEMSRERVSVVGLTIADLEHRFALSRRSGNQLKEAMVCAMDQVGTIPGR
ncbi:MAG: hypothetical protein AAGA48_32765 [Myxococcota bacterium]